MNNVIGKNISENPKSFWSYIKLTKTESLGVPTLKTSQKMCSTDYDKAEALNAQFQSVFNPKLNTQVDDKGPSPFPSVPHLVIGTEGIVKQLMNLNPSKACGPEEMSSRFLKIFANEQWRQALVTGIHKGGTKSEPSNYPPISLTCVCCKIMEHVVLSHVAKHLSVHKILTDEQHGFRDHLSTVTQLITSVNDRTETINQKGQTDVILLDFSKAFDRVSHQHLSTKLEYYGIRNSTLAWINSFLSNRK